MSGICQQVQILARLRRINPQNTQCIPGINPDIARIKKDKLLAIIEEHALKIGD